MFDGLTALAAHRRVWVLTGAGVSCASGLPTYRDAAGRWQASRPVQHGEFVRDPAMRQRYWTRSAIGWPRFAAARPNPAHRSLATLEGLGVVSMLVTQNVDRLHQRAGSRSVLDLHGRLDRVVCLDCGERSARADLQQRLLALNPHLADADGAAARSLADGDAEADASLVAETSVPPCERCGGVLKPDVVFYGGSVDAAVVEAARASLESADALLVVGSSLQVWSGLRFVREAAALGLPCYLINAGETRDAERFVWQCEEDLSAVLADWQRRCAPG